MRTVGKARGGIEADGDAEDGDAKGGSGIKVMNIWIFPDWG
jgi:hypothetical protein